MVFTDRVDAGRRLAEKLSHYARRDDLLVLALPRGGVPVAHQVAQRLQAPLEVFLVRKLGVPGHEELAMGAVASDVLILDEAAVQRLQIPRQTVEEVIDRERRELDRRERAYRDNRPRPSPRGRCVILIDDGVATGASLEAAIAALRQQDPRLLVAAVPVAPAATVERLGAVVDEFVTVHTPEPFESVGQWYDDFSQTTDEEVRNLLNQS